MLRTDHRPSHEAAEIASSGWLHRGASKLGLAAAIALSMIPGTVPAAEPGNGPGNGSTYKAPSTPYGAGASSPSADGGSAAGSAASGASGSARLRFLEGKLQIVRADSETIDDAMLNEPVFAGDAATTGAEARAEFQFPGGAVVRLDQGSRLNFLGVPSNDTPNENTVLQLHEGTAQIDLRQAPPQGIDFRIDTPSASVYLLASGDYRIDIDRQSNKVRVSSYRGIAEVVGDNGNVVLRSGQRTSVGSAGDPDPPRAFNTASADPFDGWVENRNATYNRATGGSDDFAQDEIPEQVQPYRSELSHYGTWVDIAPYGRCWVPGGVSAGWRPYVDGYWSATPYGQFWVSYDPWGWAPYHYGRWVWSIGFGWAWTPGCSFAPAWVSWYYGPSYFGWAPLNYWNYPCSYGYGYYWGVDYRCWNFVTYNNIYVHNVNHALVPTNVVRNEIGRHPGVIVRQPVAIPTRLHSGGKIDPATIYKQAQAIPKTAQVQPQRPTDARESFRVAENREIARAGRRVPSRGLAAQQGGSSRGASASGSKAAPSGSKSTAPGASTGARVPGSQGRGVAPARPKPGAGTSQSGSASASPNTIPTRPRSGYVVPGVRSGAPYSNRLGQRNAVDALADMLPVRPNPHSVADAELRELFRGLERRATPQTQYGPSGARPQGGRPSGGPQAQGGRPSGGPQSAPPPAASQGGSHPPSAPPQQHHGAPPPSAPKQGGGGHAKPPKK